jgi:hypothetical protein
VLWLGVLGYLTYCYGMYAMGVHWNQLFLLYVALFGLSLAALIIGLVGTDVGRLHAAFVRRPPVRSVATYLLAVAVLVAALWLVEEVPATLHGVVPATVTQFATPTNIVHVFDLAIVLPAMVVAAVQLLRDRPWGYLLSGMLLVKATAIGLWILAITWFTARTGYPTPAAPTVFFAALTVSGGVLAWRFLQALGRGTTRTSASKVFAH